MLDVSVAGGWVSGAGVVVACSWGSFSELTSTVPGVVVTGASGGEASVETGGGGGGVVGVGGGGAVVNLKHILIIVKWLTKHLGWGLRSKLRGKSVYEKTGK